MRGGSRVYRDRRRRRRDSRGSQAHLRRGCRLSATPENLARLASALAPHAPYLGGALPGLPFRWDSETIRRGLNFTLQTSLGAIDLLGEVPGGGNHDQLIAHTEQGEIAGGKCLVVDMETLIRLKRTAGRPKISGRLRNLKGFAKSGRQFDFSAHTAPGNSTLLDCGGTMARITNRWRKSPALVAPSPAPSESKPDAPPSTAPASRAFRESRVRGSGSRA